MLFSPGFLVLTLFGCVFGSSLANNRKGRTFEEWTQLFKKREVKGNGSIAKNRILEIDPLPSNFPNKPITSCYNFSEELAHSTRSMNEDAIRGLKRRFWEENRLMGLSFLHPLCIDVMAECVDVLNANEIVEILDKYPFLIFFNNRLLMNITDFSAFSPAHVQECFESPLKSGLNLARLPNLLRTLSPESLVRLIEMTDWDLEEWEMRALYEARGGTLQSLLDIFGGHLNGMTFLSTFPWLLHELIIGNHFLVEPCLDRMIRLIEEGQQEKEQIFIAVVHAIVYLESFISSHLSILKNGHFPLPNSDEVLKKFISDKKRLLVLVAKEFGDDAEFLSFVRSPMALITKEYLPFLIELVGAEEFPYSEDIISTSTSFDSIFSFLDILKKHLGEMSFYTTGSVARKFLCMAITFFPEASEEEINHVMDIFYDNRLHILHNESILAMSAVWPNNELVQMTHTDPNAFSQFSIRKIGIAVKEILIEAHGYCEQFVKTCNQNTAAQENVSAWVNLQMRLQVAGAIIGRYDPTYVADKLIPHMFEDGFISVFLSQYPSTLIPQESILHLVRGDFNHELLDRFIYNLIDYKMFTGTDYQNLQLDFSRISRGLHTIHPVQIVSYLKSKNGIINDPISFVGSLSHKHIWSVGSFSKHLQFYIRLPMVVESPNLGSFLGLAFTAPSPSGTLWDFIKWTINCEILYQEFLVIGRANIEFDELLLFFTESNNRSKVIEALNNDANSDDLQRIAVGKTVQSIPLSQDRLNFFLNSNNRASMMINKLFPTFSAKTARSKLQKSIQNFRILIKKLAPTEQEREFWIFLLDICAGDWDALGSTDLENENIPIYYRSLLKRRLEMI